MQPPFFGGDMVSNQLVGTARCAVRVACSGAIIFALASLTFVVFRPLHAGGNAAARRPYHHKPYHYPLFATVAPANSIDRPDIL